MTSRLKTDMIGSFAEWFGAYCDSFSTPVLEDQRNIITKRDHTREVCVNAVQIARDLGLSEWETMIAETIALFHDVGRFSQYRQYQTFDDSISVNHAALGAKVLLENNVLANLPKRDRNIIIHAVALHNVFSLPEGLDPETLLFAKITRDADKLDILRVVLEYFDQDAGSRAEAVALGLPDDPGYSEDVLAALRRGEMARKSSLRTLNDFKLLQLAWMYDLNFAASARIVLERDYIARVAQKLPATDEIITTVRNVLEYVHRKARAD